MLKNIKRTKEMCLFWFFCFLFFVLFVRLFYLQVIRANHYEAELAKQHVSEAYLKADRGHIYLMDKSEKPVQLTENLMMYDVFVDPKLIGNNNDDKARFIDLVTPILYEHLCEINGMERLSKEQCVKNIEIFSRKDLLPQSPEFFYYGSGIRSEGIDSYDWTGFYTSKIGVVDKFNTWAAYSLIQERLDKRIYIWVNPKNYLWFFANYRFIEDLKSLDLSYVEIKYWNYVYIIPDKVKSHQKAIDIFNDLLWRYGYLDQYRSLESKFYPQENRYVKLVSDINPALAQELRTMKIDFYQERNENNIPILHGLWLEPNVTRYYPYGGFLSNVLGYVDKNWNAFYGIEQYFDELLRWNDGKIIWRSSAWIGQVGANDFDIEDVEDGDDIYLTIDMWIQKEVEMIAEKYQKSLIADSVSILVYDPYNWHIKASVNAPSFNANDYDDVFEYMPLWEENWFLVDNETYVDVPVYYKTWDEYKLTKTYERSNTGLKKYVSKNVYGPQVFVDKNIAMAYEPWSIFKAFTVSIGLDVDEIRFFDYYFDSGYVEVGPYKIKNADEECYGWNSFLHALIYSCNVGMVRVAQRVGKEGFYNYLTKLGFGRPTNIELAWEDEWYVDSVSSVSFARYLNNSFGQWLLATPLQIAAWYWALVNGWYYVKPTVVAWIRDKNTWGYYPNKKEVLRQIFRPETVEEIKNGLYQVMEWNPGYIKYSRVEWYTLGGKSWTSQISYKWRYQNGVWWTNGSFVWLVTKENPNYIVVIQVRRPRSSLWWWQTAGRIFRELGEFLISYSLIEK